MLGDYTKRNCNARYLVQPSGLCLVIIQEEIVMLDTWSKPITAQRYS